MCGHLFAKLHLRQKIHVSGIKERNEDKQTLRLYISNVLEKYNYVYKLFF